MRDLTPSPPGPNLGSPASRSSHQGPAHLPGSLEETKRRHVVRGFEQHRFCFAFVKDTEAVQLHGAAPLGRRLDPRPAHRSAAAVLQNSRGRLLTGPDRLLPPSLGPTSGSGRGRAEGRVRACACVYLSGGALSSLRSVPEGLVSACVAVPWRMFSSGLLRGPWLAAGSAVPYQRSSFPIQLE